MAPDGGVWAVWVEVATEVVLLGRRAACGMSAEVGVRAVHAVATDIVVRHRPGKYCKPELRWPGRLVEVETDARLRAVKILAADVGMRLVGR